MATEVFSLIISNILRLASYFHEPQARANITINILEINYLNNFFLTRNTIRITRMPTTKKNQVYNKLRIILVVDYFYVFFTRMLYLYSLMARENTTILMK